MKKNILKRTAAGLSVILTAGVLVCGPVLAAETEQAAAQPSFAEKYTALREKLEAEKSGVVVGKIPEGQAYIPKDTVINVELMTELTSKKAKKGDTVPLQTLENIIINGVIVVPAGTRVEGVITKATGSGLFVRAGKLEFSINSVKTLNGINVPLQYTTKKEAGSDGGAVAVAAAVSLIGGLFMRGKNVSFPAGSKFDAVVTADTDLKVKLADLAKVMNPEAPHGVSIMIK